MAMTGGNGLAEQAVRHHILLENRDRLAVSGVEEVERFDENEVVLATALGALIIRGENLHIEQLSLDGGELKVEGAVDSMTYEAPQERRGFWSRLLG